VSLSFISQYFGVVSAVIFFGILYHAKELWQSWQRRRQAPSLPPPLPATATADDLRERIKQDEARIKMLQQKMAQDDQELEEYIDEGRSQINILNTFNERIVAIGFSAGFALFSGVRIAIFMAIALAAFLARAEMVVMVVGIVFALAYVVRFLLILPTMYRFFHTLIFSEVESKKIAAGDDIAPIRWYDYHGPTILINLGCLLTIIASLKIGG